MAIWRRTLSRRRRAALARSRHRGLKNSTRLLRFAKIGFILVVIGLVASFAIVPLFAFGLPSPDQVVRREGFSTKILDRNGKPLYDIFEDERRTPINLEEVPVYLRQATIAIEDKNFYKHGGFDPFGMLRGASRILTRGRAQGGSTLTQQLVKNVLLSPERTIWRKVREFILAIQIEKKYSKDEILQLYLNEAPYGGTAWGVETAAETYFGKKVSELDLVESAFLAGLPQRPSTYSPYSTNPDAYKTRTKEVLRRMREDKYITKEQEEGASDLVDNLEFIGRGASFKAPHFVQYVQSLLEERYGENVVQGGGLKVTTTLDLKLQEKAQSIVSEEVEKVESLNIGNGAAVAIDPETGEILAMVGSKDFNDPDYDGQVNVTMSLRQPGSAIKPITYATALSEGYTASTLIMDTPTKFPGGIGKPLYEPLIYVGKFRGPVQLRFALANSINVAAVKILALTGIKDTLKTAYNLGITSLKPDKETLNRVGLSLTLGGGEVRLLELTGAYSAFLNGGFKVEPVAILKVEDANGNILEENEPQKGKRVIKEEYAYIIADILSDNNARSDVFGLNSLLNIPGRKIAVKTGTTNDKRDNWTIGGNAGVVIGVWVGNNDNSPMTSVASGVTGASPIWRRILLHALDSGYTKSFEAPKSIVTVDVDKVSGYRAHDGYPARSEIFAKGSEPGEDTVHTKLKICKNEGKLATPSDIAAGNYDENEYFVFKEEDPTAAPGEPNRWQEGILEWINTQSDGRYKPPTEYCGTENPLSISFLEPTNETSNLPNSFKVRIRAESTVDISKVELFADGKKIKEFNSLPFTYEIDNLADGTHNLKAKALDVEGRERETDVNIGVNTQWNDASPTPAPTP